jgi:hypothetical protein
MAFLAAASASFAAEPSAPAKPFTVDDLWTLERVGAPVISPDGLLVAFTVSVPDAEKHFQQRRVDRAFRWQCAAAAADLE